MNTNTENWWISIGAKKREELAATKDKFPESLSYEEIEIIFLEYQCKAVNNYDSLLYALKKIMDSAENKKVEFFIFDKWCDDIKEAIKNAER